jgi:The GLUG motif.
VVVVGSNLDGGTVSNSYSTGNVTGELRYVGGLVGKNYNSTVSNSYWNSDSKITENSKDVSQKIAQIYQQIIQNQLYHSQQARCKDVQLQVV